jgi:glutamate-1-semialdehyde 2,1-aminomutase
MRSAAKRSLAAFPAGCNGEFNLPPELATVIVRGKGCELLASDGRRMLDFSMGWGSVLVGHGRSEVANAVAAQVRQGANFAYVTEQSLALAEEIIQLSPACETVRFCASGTEATMYCLRLARAYTGRSKILKFEGAYHGAHDLGVASLFPTAPPDYPHSTSTSTGVDASAKPNVLVAPFNDLEATRTIVQNHSDELAAIIVEPLQRCLAPVPGFLSGLRQLASGHGTLLIFDEVVTGFRLAYGGAQQYYGIVPDLVAYGKALGGGMPIGAFGGSRQIMDLVREDRMNRETYVWVASTLGGNPVCAAAANAALRIYRHSETYPRLRYLGEYLRAGLRSVLSEHGITSTVLGDGPLAQMAFTDATIRDYRSSQHRDKDFARRLMLELFAQGVFLNPMGTKLYLSLAHDEPACDEFCEILSAALQAVAS